MRHVNEKLIYVLVVVSLVLMVLVFSTSIGNSNRDDKIVATVSETFPPTPITILASDVNDDVISSVEDVVPVEPEETQEPLVEDEDQSIEEKYANEIVYLAKTVYGEAQACSKIEQAGVIWCVLNRVDSEISGMPDNIIDVILQPNQFHGYSVDFPVKQDIYDLVIDVLGRWEAEKNGETDVGRVLPSEYLWFHGDGVHNYFRDAYSGGIRWDWSLPNPYI